MESPMPSTWHPHSRYCTMNFLAISRMGQSLKSMQKPKPIEKEKFDAVLGKMLKAPPMPLKELSSRKKLGRKKLDRKKGN